MYDINVITKSQFEVVDGKEWLDIPKYGLSKIEIFLILNLIGMDTYKNVNSIQNLIFKVFREEGFNVGYSKSTIIGGLYSLIGKDILKSSNIYSSVYKLDLSAPLPEHYVLLKQMVKEGEYLESMKGQLVDRIRLKRAKFFHRGAYESSGLERYLKAYGFDKLIRK